LKPLNIGGSDVTDKEALMKKEHMERLATEAKAAQLAELEERLAKAKRQRELHEKLKGKSLGESLGEEKGMNTAAAWVQRSRLRAAQEKLMAEKRAALLLEQEEAGAEDEIQIKQEPVYGADALKGLGVAHSVDEFAQGTTVLVLKDKGVLDDDEPDMLQNATMATDDRYKEMNKEKAKAAKPVYTGEDDASFDPSLRNAGLSARILKQYDEEKKRGAGMILDGRETITSSDLKQMEAVKDRMAAAKALRPGEILTDLSTKKEEISDYYTKKEAVAFKRPRKKMRKKKRRAKKATSFADELERNPQLGVDEGSRDRGSRRSGGSGRRAERGAAKQKQNDLQYQQAIQKARAKALNLYDAEEDDVFLQQSVERARRWSQLSKAQASENVGGDEQVVRPIADISAEKAGARAAKLREEETTKARENAEDGTDDQANNSGKIVFTNTTEFTKRLAARMASRRIARKGKSEAEEKARRAQAASKEAETSDMEEDNEDNDRAEGEEGEDGAWATVRRSKGGDDMEREAPKRKSAATVTSEPLVSCGMAATMALLSRSGELKNKVAFAGRSKDEQMEVMKVSKNVTIEYKDEWGRLLTPKEAFRQLSYKFHGRKPGRKKQDKILRKLREDLHVNSGEMNDTPLGIMKAMRAKQKSSQQAYVVLRGGEDHGKKIKKKR